MKRFCLPVLLPLLLCACRSSPSATGRAARAWTPPPAGTVVAADSMKIKDPLNDFYFAVRLTVSPANENANSSGFAYDVAAHYGPNAARSSITMPIGGSGLRPLLRKDAAREYTYIIGFVPGPDYGGDSTFQDYYAVSGSHGAIEIRALKSYHFR